MTVNNLFRVTPSLQHNYLYNCAYAARRGLTFLTACNEVDSGRLGVYGISWGGVVTLLTAATDSRVKAAVNIFGAGFMPEGATWMRRFSDMNAADRKRWIANFDPSAMASRITCPVLSMTGTNDGCYWLPGFAQTQGLMNAQSRELLLPNLNHKIDGTGRQALWAWLRSNLQQRVAPVEQPVAWRSSVESNRLTVRIGLGGKRSARSVTLTYMTSGVGWARAEWRSVKARRGRDGYSVSLPLAAKPQYLYATARYGDGLALSTPVHTLCSVTFPYGPRLFDAPFMSPGVVYGAAQALARDLGADAVQPAGDGAAILVFGPREVEVAARRGNGVYYLPLRKLASAIGAVIHWQNQTVYVSPPRPERLAQLPPATVPTVSPQKPAPQPELKPTPGKPTAARTEVAEPEKSVPESTVSSVVAPVQPARAHSGLVRMM